MPARMIKRNPKRKKQDRNKGFLVEKAKTRAPIAQISLGIGCSL